jgi:hypothetical protein
MPLSALLLKTNAEIGNDFSIHNFTHTESRIKNQKSDFGVNQTCAPPLIIASAAPVPDIAGDAFRRFVPFQKL